MDARDRALAKLEEAHRKAGLNPCQCDEIGCEHVRRIDALYVRALTGYLRGGDHMSSIFGPEPAKKKHTCGYAGPDKAQGAGSCGKWVQIGEQSTSWVGDDGTRIRYCAACAHKGGWAAAPKDGPAPGPTAPGPTAPGPTAPGPTAPGPTAPGPTAPGPQIATIMCPHCNKGFGAPVYVHVGKGSV